MTEGQIRVAIETLRAYTRGEIAADAAISDELLNGLETAIEQAFDAMNPIVCDVTPSA